MQFSPDAGYDVLQILNRLSGPFNGASQSHLHYAAYLACLMSIYDGKLASDWGYGFVASGWGTPFSEDISATARELISAGYIILTEEHLVISGDGTALLVELGQLQQNKDRERYLRAACSSLVAMPTTFLREALSAEPTVRSAELKTYGGALLDSRNPALTQLYEHFSALSKVLPAGTTNLFLPALTWMTYLQETSIARMKSENAN